MRKFLLLLALGFSCSALADAFNPGIPGRTRQDVQIKEATLPSKPVRTRAAFSAAGICYSAGFLYAAVNRLSVGLTNPVEAIYFGARKSDALPMAPCIPVTGEKQMIE